MTLSYSVLLLGVGIFLFTFLSLSLFLTEYQRQNEQASEDLFVCLKLNDPSISQRSKIGDLLAAWCCYNACNIVYHGSVLISSLETKTSKGSNILVSSGKKKKKKKKGLSCCRPCTSSTTSRKLMQLGIRSCPSHPPYSP